MSDTTQVEPPDRRSRRTSESDCDPVFWDIEDLLFHCRIGRSTAWRLVREPGFPAPLILGRRTLVWPRGEVMSFLEEKRDPGHYEQRSDEPDRQVLTVRPSRRRVS